MRKFTTHHTVYNFDELDHDAREKAIDSFRYVNVDYEWWDYIYDDANLIGLSIDSFDLYPNDITGHLTEDLPTVCKRIMAEHGEGNDSYVLAEKWQHKHGEDNEAAFLHELLPIYLTMLRENYDYLIDDPAVIETIEANEYEFYKDGRQA